MKTTTLKISRGIIRTALLLFLAFSLIECRGPRGFDGMDGHDGLDGDVYAYSALYDVSANQWSGDVDGYHTYMNVPEYTEDIYYDGAILIYRLNEDDMSSYMLPNTYVENALTIYLDYNAFVGEVELTYREVFEGANDTNAPGFMTFKVLIIEGIPLAVVKNMVDVKDYNAVVKTFKLDNTNERYIKAY
jgi:hypothetical protein